MGKIEKKGSGANQKKKIRKYPNLGEKKASAPLWSKKKASPSLPRKKSTL